MACCSYQVGVHRRSHLFTAQDMTDAVKDVDEEEHYTIGQPKREPCWDLDATFTPNRRKDSQSENIGTLSHAWGVERHSTPKNRINPRLCGAWMFSNTNSGFATVASLRVTHCVDCIRSGHDRRSSAMSLSKDRRLATVSRNPTLAACLKRGSVVGYSIGCL